VKGNLHYLQIKEIIPKTWNDLQIKQSWENFKKFQIYNSLKMEGSTFTLNEVSRTINGENINTKHTKAEEMDLQGLIKAYDYVKDNLHRFPKMSDLDEINLWVGFAGKRIEYAGNIRGTIPMKRKDVEIYSGGRVFIGVFAGTNGINLTSNLQKALDNAKIDKSLNSGYKFSANATLMQYYPDGNKRTARLVQDWVNGYNGYIPTLIDTKRAEVHYEDALQDLFYRENGDLYIRFMQKQYKHSEEIFNEFL
jgi:Fic family protein